MTVLPAIVAVLAAGGLVNGVRLDAWKWAAIALLLWLGSIPFTLLGLGNGYRLTAQTTGVMNMVCNLTLAVVGGLWFPLSLFPSWLRSLSAYTPTNRFARARHVGRRRARARPRGGAGADRMAAGLRLVRCGLVPQDRADRLKGG